MSSMRPYDDSLDPDRRDAQTAAPAAVRRARITIIVQLALGVLLVLIGIGMAASATHPARPKAATGGAAAVAGLLGIIGLGAFVGLVVAAVSLNRLRPGVRLTALLSEAYYLLISVVGMATSHGKPVTIIGEVIGAGIAAYVLYELLSSEARGAFVERRP